MRHLAGALLILAACRASAPSQTKQAPVPPTIHSLAVDFDNLSEVRLSPELPVAGTNDTISVQLPGGFPGRIAHAALAAGGQASVVEGILASDAPLRFLRVSDIVRAESFDGSIVYEAPESVTVTPPASPDQRCCTWQEGTRWRAAPGAAGAGLLRAVTPPLGHWSVIDWYLPGNIEPAWRLQITEGFTSVIAAAVSPRADQIVVVLADTQGASIVRALATGDGHTLWTTSLDTPAADWRGNEGHVVYSFDGARFAVIVQDPSHCESCSAIAVFESRTGKHARTVPLKDPLATHFASLGFAGNAVWIFVHVPPKQTDMSRRPESCWYEYHDLSTGAHRTLEQTAPEWGLAACATWALMPRFGKDGVVGLALSEPGKLTVLTADEAP
jgi:hypothetical protein